MLRAYQWPIMHVTTCPGCCYNLPRTGVTCSTPMHLIYTTKIDGVVCPPNISETVAVRTVKLTHRPRIASTTIKFISKPILLSIL